MVALALGQPRAGLALAVGLVLGSLNGVLARRGVASGLPVSATSLARLQREQSRGAEARASLAPVYARFTEGLATADLKAAKRLLEQLA